MAPDSPKYASVKRILRGDTPTVIFYRGQNNGRLQEAVDELVVQHRQKLGLGVVLRIPPHTQKSAAKYLGEHSRVPLLLADPELHRNPDSKWPRKEDLTKRAKEWSYLSSYPEKPSKKWAAAVTKLQYDLGATVALSASGWVDDANAKAGLQEALRYVTASREALGDAPMLVNLTMNYRWLSEPTLRDILLNEVVESEENAWYLRFDWPEMKVRYRQLIDEPVLAGYKDVATTFALEDRRLFLANSGLTGWVSTALGATGFSTGQSWDDQKFAPDPIRRNRPGVPPPPSVPRILDPKLMNTIEYSEFQRLDDHSGHADLPTSFGLTMDTDGHTRELAGLHHVATVGNLQATLASGRQNIQALRRVKAAEKFLDGLDPVDLPTGSNDPQHLQLWRKLLS